MTGTVTLTLDHHELNDLIKCVDGYEAMCRFDRDRSDDCLAYVDLLVKLIKAQGSEKKDRKPRRDDEEPYGGGEIPVIDHPRPPR